MLRDENDSAGLFIALTPTLSRAGEGASDFLPTIKHRNTPAL
jgi:hypothetical protein